jgi:lactoylglutathione lyase
MKYCWSTLTVRDMAESLTFYQEVVGLPLVRRFQAGPDTEIAFLGEGETQIELICHQSQPEVRMGSDISLGFTVCSLDQQMALLGSRGIPILAGPIQPNPSLRFIFVQDPNGLKIQFVENCQ